MVYTRLYVLVVAFYNWAVEEFGKSPQDKTLEGLYLEITKLCRRYHNGDLKSAIDCIKTINNMGKVPYYAPWPWGLAEGECNKFLAETVRKYATDAVTDLEKNKHNLWSIDKSRDWWNLFISNYNLDDDKACKL